MPASPTPTSQRNLDGYDAPLIEWERVSTQLLDEDTGGPNRYTPLLATVDADGTPHVMPVGVVWLDGIPHFTSGPGTRKARNIARNPRVSLNAATDDLDLAIEGTAARVSDEAQLERAAAAFARRGWAPTVRDGGFHHEFSAPSAGPPPWHLYAITPKTVFALGTTDPYGATRYDF